MPADRLNATALLDGLSLLSVRITEEGALLLDGRPTSVPPADTLHEFILDTAQKQARTRGTPIVVAIDDRPAGYATTIAVAPDGSSQLLDAEEPATEEPATGEPAATPAPDAEQPDPLGTGSDRRSATAGWADDATYGLESADTAEVHGIAAYVAYTRGDHGQATALFLETARIRHAAGDSRAPHDVKWATIAWMMLGPARAKPYEKLLFGLWSELAADGLAPVDEYLYDCAQRTAERLADTRPGSAVRGRQTVGPADQEIG
ncbi:hypothetical protein V2S66_21245 [Streptomyces sp. V4-01]|uniref:Uncharacterized protein n=1 Tax=Actinacidiphila polyblastidii TaxID=3110430 RepID=A0ABU7PHE0_9ACTN|nr:hypothetical protein [Streptomyces sp. V4-01]